MTSSVGNRAPWNLATYARCTEFESYEDVAMSMDAGQSLELTKERFEKDNFEELSPCVTMSRCLALL